MTAARLAGAAAKLVKACEGSVTPDFATSLLSIQDASPDFTDAEANQLTIPPATLAKLAGPAPTQAKPAEAAPMDGAPQPPQPTRHVARFMRFHGRDLPKFGIAGRGEPPEEGEEVLVHTKAGELRTVKVREILWEGDGYRRADMTWQKTENNREATFDDQV
ncbi:MAG: hypothetical protein NT154_13480 [Verrucomicrobia bacterium]|nr:hypothetical protein [Verrucomicrobiota bacterium]